MEAKPKSGINLKKAKIGAKLLADPSTSLKSAALAAGYAESTASKPTANGITVERCIAEAVKLDPSLEPEKLVQGARKVFAAKIEQALDDPETIAKARFSDVARLLEVAEKCYNTDLSQDQSPRGFVDRLEWLAELQAELERRKVQDVVVEATTESP